MGELEDKIRWMCARLLQVPPESEAAVWYRSELIAATAKLAAQNRDWNKPAEGDKHQDEARQSYGTREKDSADGFAEGLKLFNPKKPDSDKEKN